MLNCFYEYYEIKFGKRPKIIRKVSNDSHKKSVLPSHSNSNGQQAKGKQVASRGGKHVGEGSVRESKEGGDADKEGLRVNGNQIRVGRDEEDGATVSRILRPLSQFLSGSTNDVRELALIISRDICRDSVKVRWSDVVGLESAKNVLKESVVIPSLYPDLFDAVGLLSPWRGVLLYGPPGTGKTLLAKAVATECNATFFNISASSIVSKYRGDSEKLVRVLFDLARYHSPSTIFLDEIDSIMSQRGSSGSGEHEASRRMKTELLIQMDGLCQPQRFSKDQAALSRIFILAASNLPWDLDSALLRRLEKRVLVDLPNEAARAAMFRHYFPAERCPDLDVDVLAAHTRDYSCADITLVCKEAAMQPVRRVIQSTKLQPEVDLTNVELKSKLTPVSMDDAMEAILRTKPATLPAKQDTYQSWRNKYGSE